MCVYRCSKNKHCHGNKIYVAVHVNAPEESQIDHEEARRRSYQSFRNRSTNN